MKKQKISNQLNIKKSKNLETIKQKNINKKTGNNKLSAMAVVAVVVVFTVILGVQMKDMKKTDASLSKKEQNLNITYETESKRTSELEEQRVYVQTKKYIEEAARKIGFVYPDEIILKPNEKN